MDADLKALHRAVNAVLRARRDAKRTARAASKAGINHFGVSWDRREYIDRLEAESDQATNALNQAETEVLTLWEALDQAPAQVLVS